MFIFLEFSLYRFLQNFTISSDNDMILLTVLPIRFVLTFATQLHSISLIIVLGTGDFL